MDESRSSDAGKSEGSETALTAKSVESWVMAECIRYKLKRMDFQTGNAVCFFLYFYLVTYFYKPPVVLFF